MQALDADILAEEIRRFLMEQDGYPSHAQQRTDVTVNFKNTHAKFELNEVCPSAIKDMFGITSGTLTLEREKVIYKETDDDEFEPPLVCGTYSVSTIFFKDSMTIFLKNTENGILTLIDNQENHQNSRSTGVFLVHNSYFIKLFRIHQQHRLIQYPFRKSSLFYF